MSTDRGLISETVRSAIYSDPSVQSRWESMVHDLMTSDSVNDPQSIAFQIRKSGILDQIVRKLLQDKPVQPTKRVVVADIVEPSRDRGIPIVSSSPDQLAGFLSLENIPIQIGVKHGHNFVDYGSVGSLSQAERPVLQLVFSYSGLRFASDLYLAETDVVFSADTQFAFNLPLPAYKASITWQSVVEYLLNAKQKIIVYLLEFRQASESWIPSLKMHGTLEWRHCLHSSSVNKPLRVELKGVGEVAQQSLGFLELEAQLGLDLPATFVTSDVAELHLTIEASKRTEAERTFINYARLWHKDFIELSPVLLARRAVKLFVHDERGAVRFLSSFIQVHAPGRLIETPQQCARFVSLFSSAPRELHTGTGEQDDIWFSLEASLISSTTTSGGRAVMLCSFFLGMGLDAYVCIGRATSMDVYEDEEVVRIWVMTVATNGESTTNNSGERVVFWDPLVGSSFLVRPKSASVAQQCPFRTIDCVFRHDHFLANVQPENKLIDVSFDFHDNEKWHALDVSACPQIEPCGMLAKLQPWSNRRFGSNYCAMADWLEEEFTRLFAEHRHNLELPRVEWDQRLSVTLGIALSNYEMASTFGSNFTVPKDFLTATRNIIPHNCVLRAVPMQLPLESVATPTRAFTSALTRCQAARDVVELPGHVVRAALRVKVVPYAERVAAVWLMVASYSK